MLPAAVLTVVLAFVHTLGAAGTSSGPRQQAAVAPSVAGATLHYRLTREPVVVVYPTSDGPPFFQVRVRMNHSLPVDRQGVRANFLVGRSGSDADPEPFGEGSRHCYASVVGNDVDPDPRLSRARPGSKARLTIRIAAHRQIVRTVTLRSPGYIELRTLGCGMRH
jgi:hypothetical protein